MSTKIWVFVVVSFIVLTQCQAQTDFLKNILKRMLDEALYKLNYISRDSNSTENIGGFLKTLLERFRGDLKTGNPKLGIPVADPFKVSPFNYSTETSVVSVTFRVFNLVLSGLSSYQIKRLDTYLDSKNIYLEANLSLLNGTGNFTFDGSAFFSISGSGVISAELKNIFISLNMTLCVTPEEKLQIGNLTTDITIGSIDIDVPQIFGGGLVANILGGIIRGAGSTIFNIFRPTFIGQINEAIKTATNNALMQLPEGLLLPESMANSFVDKLLKMIKVRPEFQKLDPIALPNYSKGIPLVAQVKTYGGKVTGIKTLRRTGDVIIGGRNDTIFIAGAMGMTELAIKYSGSATAVFQTRDLKVDGSISRISVAFLVSMSAQKEAHPELEEFTIVELSPIMLQFTTNFFLIPVFTNLLSAGLSVLITPIIKATMSNNIKGIIASQLQNITLPI